MLAASKRIIYRASGSHNNNNNNNNNEDETVIIINKNNNIEGETTPERTRRSFVLSASGNRRSRSKTSPMISPIENVEKFISENQENEVTTPTNVRRTISSIK